MQAEDDVYVRLWYEDRDSPETEAIDIDKRKLRKATIGGLVERLKEADMKNDLEHCDRAKIKVHPSGSPPFRPKFGQFAPLPDSSKDEPLNVVAPDKGEKRKSEIEAGRFFSPIGRVLGVNTMKIGDARREKRDKFQFEKICRKRSYIDKTGVESYKDIVEGLLLLPETEEKAEETTVEEQGAEGDDEFKSFITDDHVRKWMTFPLDTEGKPTPEQGSALKAAS